MKNTEKILTLLGVLLFFSCSEQRELDWDFTEAPPLPELSQEEADLVVENLPGRESPLFLNLEYIQTLPWATLESYYPYLKANDSFQGFPLLDFMEWLGMSQDQHIKIYARDGYSVLLTVEAMEEYQHWVTYKQGGQFYSERPLDDQRGPYALVFAADLSEEEILTNQYQLIWLIEKIVVTGPDD